MAVTSLMLTAVIVVPGCKSPTTTVVQAEGVLITTVDTGMKVWATYVNAGHATQAQVDKVKAAYNVYYTAQLAAQAAIEKVIENGTGSQSDVNIANAAVTAAEQALLQLLNQYIK